MQTFLPVPNLITSARILDNKRLGKQRVEAFQIISTLDGTMKGWENHPAVKMWEGYEKCLGLYGMICCAVWMQRGFKDWMYYKFSIVVFDSIPKEERPPLPLYSDYPEQWMKINRKFVDSYIIYPPWWGNEDFHRSHQSNLVRKDPGKYRQVFPSIPNNLPYIWPKYS